MTPAPPLDTAELYRVLAENATDAIVTIDDDSVILSVNPAAERLFGYTAAELIGSALLRLMPERYHAGHQMGMRRYIATGRRHISWKGVQVAICTRDGREVPTEISFGEFVSGSNRVFSAIIRDVSERIAVEAALAASAEQLQTQAVELEHQVEEAQVIGEELEQTNEELRQANSALEQARAAAEASAIEAREAADALRSREEEYRALANSIPTLAWMARPDGWIFWYNERWYEYTGTTPADMEGWGWQSVHHPDSLQAVLAEWTRSIETGEPFEMTFPLRRADGTFRPFLTRVFPLRDESGAIVRWFGTNTDISYEHDARVAAERAATRTRQLQSLTSLLARAQTLEDVASVVVHEAVQATGAATGMLAILEAHGNEVVMLGEVGLPDEVRDDYLRFPITRDTPTAECLRTGRPIFIAGRDGPDGLLERYPALRDVWDRVGRNALATIPLLQGDKAVAAMSFTFAEPTEFNEEAREFFVTLAAQGAQAIARMNAFESERRERRRSESIVEAITDGFATFDSELRFTYVNARAAAMFGVDRSAIRGTSITALPNAKDSPLVDLLRVVARERIPREREAYGTIMGRWLDLRAYPGEDGGVIVYFQDVTERRRRQDAAGFLAEASALLAASRDYHVTLRSLARASIPRLGDWCAIDLVGEPDASDEEPVQRVALAHEDQGKVELAEQHRRLYPPGPASLITRALSGESVLMPLITHELLAAHARDPRELEMTAALGVSSAMVVPLAAADHVVGAMTFCRGPSRPPYDEADLRLAEDLAARAANAVEHARLLQRAEAANAAKAEFLRTVSHELRQPLNAMKGLLQLWELGLRGSISDQQAADIERIKRNQHQLGSLIEDLLSFARLDAGKLEVTRERVVVAAVVEDVSSDVGFDLEKRGIVYSTSLSDPSVAVLADADRLHQVLVNLVTNAIRATSEGGRIDVTCDSDGERVQLHVSDTGRGIPADMLEAIFTPFVQVGRALNQPREGAGLGLAISRGLVDAMGGTLAAKSEVGVGSTFTVTLPRAPDVI